MTRDANLKRLEKHTASLEAALHSTFPKAFQNVEELVAQRKAYALSLKDNENFSMRRKAIAQANDAIKDYLFQKEPVLKQLAGRRMAILKAQNQERIRR